MYLYGTYEPIVSYALRQLVKPGDVVVDVGANIGVVTSLLGMLVGRCGHVFSFEPVPELYGILKKTISLNDLAGTVTAIHAAVGDHTSDRVVIYVPREHSHACSSFHVEDLPNAEAFECRMVSLDETESIKNVPALVKVDVEGAELSVLQGAAGWCVTVRPPIWVLEVNRRAANRFAYGPEALVDWLAERDYARFYWSDHRAVRAFEPGTKLPDDGTVYCLPQWALDGNRFLTTRLEARW
jgi:FkbM family methyltransferase